VLLLLGLYVYSAVGVQLFWTVAYTPTHVNASLAGTYFYSNPGSNYGDFLSRHANFESFGNALLTLTRCVTGESYNQIMHELMDASWSDNALRCCPTCGPVVDGVALSSCGSTWQSVIMFLSFILIMSLVVVSLFVGVRLQSTKMRRAVSADFPICDHSLPHMPLP